jgi:hypothetical protein
MLKSHNSKPTRLIGSQQVGGAIVVGLDIGLDIVLWLGFSNGKPANFAVEANSAINWGVFPSCSPRLCHGLVIDAELGRYRPIRPLWISSNCICRSKAFWLIGDAAVA